MKTECACKAARLNPEPADYLVARMARLRAAGETPGNPKWYKPPTLQRFEFEAGLPPKFPAGLCSRIGNEAHRKWVLGRMDERHDNNIQAYVKAFDRANGFKQMQA